MAEHEQTTEQQENWLIGVDTGGTFTDVVASSESGEVRIAKVPSTPPAFEEGIINGLNKLGIPPAHIRTIHHGTTVSTNAAIMKTGAHTALVTTEGFRDVLEIRRGNREELYDILWDPPAPLVRRANRLEINERINYAGESIHEVDPEELDRLCRVLEKRGIEAVAISFLHSYVNPAHEAEVHKAIADRLPDIFVTSSSDILPEPGEFERTATTVANAYLGPPMVKYVSRLEAALRAAGYDADVLLMHSGGGLMSIDATLTVPARTIGSGPAGGVMGAAAVGRAAGRPNLITMDMGGTSCDVSVIVDGHPRTASEQSLEWGLPIRFPNIEVNAVGAGGGSIAWLDAAGRPRVGPESAGARPGPVCYRRGGEKPTVSDANLVLNRLSQGTALAGDVLLDTEAATRVMDESFATPLGMAVDEAAAGIIQIVDSTMAAAVRLETVNRGIDPREFTLIAFGGAGPLHAVGVARELGITEVLIPPNPGVVAALGQQTVDMIHDLSRPFLLTHNDDDRLGKADEVFAELETEMRGRFAKESEDGEAIAFTRSADIRYKGQTHVITVELPAGAFDTNARNHLIDAFHLAHTKEFRYSRTDWPVEIILLRVKGRLTTKSIDLSSWGYANVPEADVTSSDTTKSERHRKVYYHGSGWLESTVYDGDALLPGGSVEGPGVVEYSNSTVLLPPGVHGSVDKCRNIILKVS
ncbi:hydantoinase/oxoprolinase family protein [Rhodococcus koreensis]|uniref:hydantoinase/oxoprolinase family protein n=1 Tax=Rhodococcus koreensis TaxID=99653 RepID=UPI00366E3CA9